MRKMYFAMIPKRSFLESAVIAAGVGAGIVYGAKFLLGEEKYGSYKAQLKDLVFNSKAPKFTSEDEGKAMGPDTGMGIGDDDEKAQEEENILSRIRAAAKL